MHADIEDARRHLERLRVALASPAPPVMGAPRIIEAPQQGIEEVLPELERAIASLRKLEQELAGGAAPATNLAPDLIALSREIGMAQRLTDRGREICVRWAVLLATAGGGYLSSGRPAPLHPASSLRIEG